MKKMILMLTMSLVTASFAQAAYKDANAKRVCDSLSNSTASVECNKAIDGESISLGVTKICSQLSFGSYVADCYKAGAGSDYSDAVLNYCSNKADEYDRVTCLKMAAGNAPRLPKPAPACKETVVVKIQETVSLQALQGLETRTSNIYESLRSGRTDKALDQVVDLFKRINELQEQVKELRK
ncbi:hypothetical protein [Bdellovibrio sp. KM01]|uniref:hypothetical protein n=1 Tax=Bdellovibrio sp. KM01 TaxID=2748865 RepID=UPI0015E9D8AD|nr:hypothetical protein [Bdellovibrio sp. KM01]QLY26064.1 hypothetical protein HW988_03255 [Bdellovibrio sp. KM01]